MPNRVGTAIANAWDSVTDLFSDEPYQSPIHACPMKEIVGANWKKAAEDAFPHQQSYQNCGVQSVRQIIEQARGICLNQTELEFLESTINTCGTDKAEKHPADSGGTNAEIRQCILKHHDVQSQIIDADVEALDLALRDRKGIVISSNANVLWQGRIDSPPSGGHAVVVTHGDYDRYGNLTGVFVNDTGINQRYRLSIEELQDALESGSGRMNVTNSPIWHQD